MVVLLEGSPISTDELWSSVRVTIWFLVSSLTKALLHQLLSLTGWPALGRVLVVPNHSHLRMTAAIALLGIFNAADIFWCLPQICASTQSCLEALQTIPSTSWLGFCADMHCQLCDLIQTSVCLSKSFEFTTGGLQSSCRNIFKDDQWKQDEHGLNFESHRKGSEYLLK